MSKKNTIDTEDKKHDETCENEKPKECEACEGSKAETDSATESTNDSAENKIAELEKKVEELSASNAELKDQMIRRQAETDNYRKRLARDKEEAVQFANSRLISDILPFLDNLDRALAAAKSGGDTEKLVEGIEMAQSQFLSNLDKDWGLKVINAVGEEFDPQKHEACMVTVDDSLEHETVLEDFIKGYTLHDRVLRPSKVRIGKPE